MTVRALSYLALASGGLMLALSGIILGYQPGLRPLGIVTLAVAIFLFAAAVIGFLAVRPRDSLK